VSHIFFWHLWTRLPIWHTYHYCKLWYSFDILVFIWYWYFSIWSYLSIY